jgi:phosphomannomutase
MSGSDSLACFKAYDIRGRIPNELNRDLVVTIARAFASWLKPKTVAVGYDIRLSSPDFAAAVRSGLTDMGVDVVDIGRCGTEQVYFATSHLNLDGGVMVTASHNPADYNGLKLVRELAKPISADTGLVEIEKITRAGGLLPSSKKGTVKHVDLQDAYVKHLLSYVDVPSLRPLKIVSNAGNGGAGVVVEALAPHLPFTFVKVHHEPDGHFPNGIPNPLLIEKREDTARAVTGSKADLGIAWDGDFDRCFLFDEKGGFIEGYYIVGLLASQVLKRKKGAKIVHDPRLTWNTIEVVRELGGIPVQSKSGHAFMKEVMRREDAAYGGEMSANHFFKEFAYCDSGMIPGFSSRRSSATRKAAQRAGRRSDAPLPASGEINRKVADAKAVIAKIRERYAASALLVDETDGVRMDFAMAVQSADVQHRAPDPVKRRVPRRRGADEIEDRRASLRHRRGVGDTPFFLQTPRAARGHSSFF